MHILLIRHGQTDSNAGGVLQGHLPTPLNDLGRRQAERLARRLASFDPAIEALVTSDLRRAVQTTAPIEHQLGLAADHDPAWRERGFGTYEGRTVGDTEVWRVATGTVDPPGAESIPALQARVAQALVTLVQHHGHRRCIAVVTHGGVMRTVLQLLAEGRLPVVDDHPRPEVGPILNGSILRLAATVDGMGGDCRWQVVGVNDVQHLAGTDVTSLDAG